MLISTAGNPGKSNKAVVEGGFTYVVVLVAVVIVGILAGVANNVVSRTMRAEREQELLFRGMAYQKAIQHYYQDTGHYPHNLRDLLKGTNLASRAYLRTMYTDPMSLRVHDQHEVNTGWRVVRAADGGIAGVSSSSMDEPMKIANFPQGLEQFEGSKHYADWIFEFASIKGSQVSR